MSCFGFRYELLRLLHSMRRLAMSCFGFRYELLRLLHSMRCLAMSSIPRNGRYVPMPVYAHVY